MRTLIALMTVLYFATGCGDISTDGTIHETPQADGSEVVFTETVTLGDGSEVEYVVFRNTHAEPAEEQGNDNVGEGQYTLYGNCWARWAGAHYVQSHGDWDFVRYFSVPARRNYRLWVEWPLYRAAVARNRWPLDTGRTHGDRVWVNMGTWGAAYWQLVNVRTWC